MKIGMSREEILQHARALSCAEHAKDLRGLVANKIEDLRYYDVLNMDRALSVCFWGRSGSLLLASYLDGHDDVILLPTSRGILIYEFYERYQSLSLHDKLIAYPIFSNDWWPYSPDFFQGEFSIAAADYYAAVAAIFEVYGNTPPHLLETRRAFFQFLHVAYNLALGRRPASPHPLMVYQQHWRHDVLARRFVEDFPQARFIHCIRDPISAFDRSFEHWVTVKGGIDALIWTVNNLLHDDQPHSGMESRTRAIRFEDLHNNTVETIRRLVDWLGLPYQVALLKSTFNGTPWVVERAGITWSGARAEQALRFSRNMTFTDRALLFVALSENFVGWNYSSPKIFGRPLVRLLTCMLLLLVPMKAEIIAVKVHVLPPLKRGSFIVVCKCLYRILRCRLAIMRLVAAESRRRFIFGKDILKIL